MSENVKTLIESMRAAVSTTKTARERVKTASVQDDFDRGDLLANTIHRITAQEEERVFPEEVRQRKEAAEKANAVKEAADESANESADDSAKEVDENKAGEQPPAESAAPAATETKEASVELPGAATLLQHPLVRKGFDDYIEEHREEVQKLAAEIVSNASITA